MTKIMRIIGVLSFFTCLNFCTLSTNCFVLAGQQTMLAIQLYNQAVDQEGIDRNRAIELFLQSYTQENMIESAYALAYNYYLTGNFPAAKYYASQAITLDNGTQADLTNKSRIIINATQGGPPATYGSADGFNYISAPYRVNENSFLLPKLSEETPPRMCPNQYFISGILCRGRYCDDKYIMCQKTKWGNTHSNVFWSGWFSEEQPNFIMYSGRAMVGISCRGGYCDNMSLASVPLQHSSGSHCYWTPRYSEEHGLNLCQAGYLVAGIQCHGSNCDDVALYCCQE